MPTLHERKDDIDISIIVPVYNLEAFLEPLLETLEMQDLGDYKAEIIFVLNNCTDGSEDVIRESGIECTILECTTHGCGPARNVGMKAATGDYIWFMDGDDWLLTPTAIKDALDKIKCNGFNVLRIPFMSDKFGGSYYGMVWQYVFKREFIEDIQFPDYQPGEDGAFMNVVFERLGVKQSNYLRRIPRMYIPLYFYNYLREGSNMYRYWRGEKI